jgi:hypothetical protein
VIQRFIFREGSNLISSHFHLESLFFPSFLHVFLCLSNSYIPPPNNDSNSLSSTSKACINILFLKKEKAVLFSFISSFHDYSFFTPVFSFFCSTQRSHSELFRIFIPKFSLSSKANRVKEKKYLKPKQKNKNNIEIQSSKRKE